MFSEDSAVHGTLDRFVQLSSALTGYEKNILWGTGMAQEYYDKLLQETDQAKAEYLLTYADKGVQVFNDKTLNPIAKAVIKLWYLGQWRIGPQNPKEAAWSISPPAYTQSLAWRAMGGHPQGARQQGFASWARPPFGVEESE